MTAKAKAIDILRKLMAHRDSAESIGNLAEAEAYAAKISDLLLRHQLEVAEIGEAQPDNPVGTMRFHPEGVKRRQQRVAWMELLTAIVAQAHGCEMLTRPGTSEVILVGRKATLEVVGYLVSVLARVAELSAEREYNKVFYREYRRKGGDTNLAKGFRTSYLNAFAVGVLDALKAAGKGVQGGTALVLSTAKETQDHIDAMAAAGEVGKTPGRALRHIKAEEFNLAGLKAGYLAGTKAPVKANAVKDAKGRKAVTS